MKNQIDLFLRTRHLDGVIRIVEEEYAGIPHGTQFTHFVLSPTTVEKGKRYAVPRILKSGRHGVSSEEELPMLSFENIFIGDCVDVQQQVSYETLTEKDFEHSLAHIQTPLQLKEYMLKRYRASRPHMSEEEIFAKGVSKISLVIHPDSQI